MDKLKAMETFVRIVEAGSLTAAADILETSLTSEVRSLAALERALGVRLLNRATRRIALTDEGREHFERCRRVLAEVEEAETTVVGPPDGTCRQAQDHHARDVRAAARRAAGGAAALHDAQRSVCEPALSSSPRHVEVAGRFRAPSMHSIHRT